MNDVIHIMVTSLCNRDCKYCCNKQYNLNDIPYVTDDELKEADTICLTGGEPFAFSNPNSIALWYKKRYPNIKNIYAYSNATELLQYLADDRSVDYLDGVTVSIKNRSDKIAFDYLVDHWRIKELASNVLYVFDGFEDVECPRWFTKIKREWQEEFTPAPNSIFRKA